MTRYYLELSELSMGTLKHVGRIRGARQIGEELAIFYLYVAGARPQRNSGLAEHLPGRTLESSGNGRGFTTGDSPAGRKGERVGWGGGRSRGRAHMLNFRPYLS